MLLTIKNILKGLVFILATTLALTATAQAETFTLATGEYPPYVSSDDPDANLATEIAAAALEATGHQLQLQIMPWARCEVEVLNNRIIGTFPYSNTPERNKQFMFSQPLYIGGGVFFFNKTLVPDFKYTNDEALSEYKLGLVRGYNWNSRFLAVNPNATVHNHLETALRQLKAGRIEVLPEGEYAGWYTIKKLFPEDYSEIGQCKIVMNSTQSGIMVSRSNPKGIKFLKLFNEGMTIIEKNGTLKAIRAKYKSI